MLALQINTKVIWNRNFVDNDVWLRYTLGPPTIWTCNIFYPYTTIYCMKNVHLIKPDDPACYTYRKRKATSTVPKAAQHAYISIYEVKCIHRLRLNTTEPFTKIKLCSHEIWNWPHSLTLISASKNLFTIIPKSNWAQPHIDFYLERRNNILSFAFCPFHFSSLRSNNQWRLFVVVVAFFFFLNSKLNIALVGTTLCRTVEKLFLRKLVVFVSYQYQN